MCVALPFMSLGWFPESFTSLDVLPRAVEDISPVVIIRYLDQTEISTRTVSLAKRFCLLKHLRLLSQINQFKMHLRF